MAAPNSASPQTQVLVGTTPIQLDPIPPNNRQFIEVFNNGPNPLWLVPTASVGAPTIVVGKAICVDPHSAWIMYLGPAIAVWAITEVAAQVDGAATMVTQYA